MHAPAAGQPGPCTHGAGRTAGSQHASALCNILTVVWSTLLHACWALWFKVEGVGCRDTRAYTCLQRVSQPGAQAAEVVGVRGQHAQRSHKATRQAPVRAQAVLQAEPKALHRDLPHLAGAVTLLHLQWQATCNGLLNQ